MSRLKEVRLTNLAVVMGVTIGWARSLAKQRVLDDIREMPRKGGPYIVGIDQVFQVVLAWRMRQVGIGYDTIRLVVDQFDVDKRETHTISLGPEMTLVLNRAWLIMRALRYFAEANELQFGVQEEAA